jgi:hypothetical protein
MVVTCSLPPSVVSDDDGAGAYTWSVDSSKAFAQIPEWIVEPPTTADLDIRRPPEHWSRIVHKGAIQGVRNVTTTSLAGWLFRFGLDFQTVTDIVLGWNLRANTPPLSDEEVTRIVCSIAERELKRLGAR